MLPGMTQGWTRRQLLRTLVALGGTHLLVGCGPPSIAFPLDTRDSTLQAIQRYWNDGDFERLAQVVEPGERRQTFHTYRLDILAAMRRYPIRAWHPVQPAEGFKGPDFVQAEAVLEPDAQDKELIFVLHHTQGRWWLYRY